MEGGQEVTYAYTTADNETVTVIRDPSGPDQAFQIDQSSSAATTAGQPQGEQIFQVSSDSALQKSPTTFTPVQNETFNYFDMLDILLF